MELADPKTLEVILGFLPLLKLRRDSHVLHRTPRGLLLAPRLFLETQA